ncbi:MAG TPA: Mn transporter [Cyanobacteria bacterium UBA8530]|nr:Mn transporter [Cyanobacteria bacterium UBA8530]
MVSLNPFKRLNWRNILLFLSVIGPGIITAAVDNDAGGITTYSLAGAHFGYGFLWTLIPITVALILVQEMSARLGAVTGKGFSDLIRERFGVRWTFYILLALFIANLGNTLAEFSGIAASTEIFGVSKYITVPTSALAVWFLVVKGSYKKIENIFLVASLFYATYVISGLMASPNWGPILKAVATPVISFHADYIAMLIGMVGTTIAPWMQFYIQSSVSDKKIQFKDYWVTRWDVIIGCLITDLVAFFVVVACAETIYRHGLNIETAKDAALALGPLAGKWASMLFAFGLFNASIFAATILPLSTTYSICEGMGWESGLDYSFKEAPAFYSIFTGIIIVGAGLILLPNAPLISIMYWSQVVNGMLLPFVLVIILWLINDKRLMGKYVNGPLFNFLTWTLTLVMVILSVLLVFSTLFPHLFGQ